MSSFRMEFNIVHESWSFIQLKFASGGECLASNLTIQHT